MGIEGVSKFLKRFQSLFYNDEGEWIVTNHPPQDASMKVLQATIKKTAEDIERFTFNTAISQFMICVNELRKLDEHSSFILEPFIRLLAPFAPFISEELWQSMGQQTSVHLASFPDYDGQWLVSTSVTYPVCVNGKKRSEINLPVDSSDSEIEKSARELPEITKWTDGKPIKKVIIIPGKMVNLVV